MKCSGCTNQNENIQKSNAMTEEKLEQSQELNKQIIELKKHYDYVKTDKEAPYEGQFARIYIEPATSESQRQLRKDLLPISLPEFVEMYLAKVEKQIKKLEKEFEKL